jgi:hypothetical protein
MVSVVTVVDPDEVLLRTQRIDEKSEHTKVIPSRVEERTTFRKEYPK